MGKTKRAKERVITLIKESEFQQLSTKEIHDKFILRWAKQAPTRARLVNILSKNKEFEQVGVEMVARVIEKVGDYEVKVWGLKYETTTDN